MIELAANNSVCDPETYNQLKYLGVANSEFTERDTIFEKAAVLLAKYDYKWGIGLVHRHCRLDEGEIMLADGNVTEPVVFSGDGTTATTPTTTTTTAATTGPVYPERWLSTGQAYEFTTRATEQPPTTLFDEFRAMIRDDTTTATANHLLGLYHVDFLEADTWLVEHTEGRKNIVEKVSSQPVLSPTMIEAGWVFGGDSSSRPSYCQQYCNQDSSGNHVGSHHVIS